MKKLLGLLLAGLFALPAGATTFTVKNTGQGGATFYSVNDSACAGDVVFINDGDYTAGSTKREYGPYPTQSGTGWAPGTRITYIGNLTDPSAVKVRAAGLSSSFVSIKGVQFDSTAGAPNAAFGFSGTASVPVRGDSVISCNITEGLQFCHATDNVIANSTVGGYYKESVGGTDARVWSDAGSCGFVERDTIDNLKIILRYNADVVTDYNNLWRWQGSSAQPIKGMVIKDTDVEFIRLSPSGCAGTVYDAFGLFWFYVQNSLVKNSKFTFYDSTGCSPIDGGSKLAYFRDFTKANLWDTDTLRVVSPAKALVYLSAAGGNPGTTGYSRYVDCEFIGEGATGFVEWQSGFNGDTLSRCSIVADADCQPTTISSINDNGLIDHCAFYALNHNTGALDIQVNNGNWNGTLNITNTGFYTRNASGGATSAALNIRRPAATSLTMSNNAFSNYAGENQSIRHTYNTGGPAYYSPSQFFTSFSTGAASLYGSPVWTDSTATIAFNPAFGATSIYSNNGVAGTDIGPVEQAAADTVRPDDITTLAVVYRDETFLVVQWVCVGDDSLTGTAASYDIRYSKGIPITEGNWSTRTQVISGLVPEIAGTLQSTGITELEPGSLYYIAIKVSDEIPNQSALSNVADGRTQSSSSGGGTGVIDP
jgi:hypothetical protein